MSDLDAQLASLGWDHQFAERFAAIASPGEVPGRVIADYGAEYAVHARGGQCRATARHVDPAVGDWVVLSGGVITGMIDRRTVLSRHAAGAETREQVLAANVDVIFIVAAATDVNARRIERYLMIAWQSGATPVVVLTKSDIAESTDALRIEVESLAAGTPVVVTSSVTGEGVAEVQRHLQPARTGVLLGPSGAGKSSLINALTGEELMRTREIHSASGEGRHMTSHRQLVLLPGGGLIIDTPGLREAQLWLGDDALADVFDDIATLALRCRFYDCAHDTEPGCAIKAALAGGSLDPDRLRSYRKLERELRAIAAKSDVRIRIEDRKKWKQIAAAAKRARP